MTSSLLERSVRPVPASEIPGERVARISWDAALPWLTLAVAVSLAILHYVQFLDVHRYLWDSGDHDRNSHYLFIQSLAAHLRSGNLPMFLKELDTARVWGPLQDGLAAPVVAFVSDYRVAVFPSVLGWIMTVMFAFLLARRAAPSGGNLAGLAAALFVLVSPSHKAYANDLMLESLGAGLTLAALYFYVVAVQVADVRSGRWLGIALTLLFLHKSNYWLLAFAGIAVTTFLAAPRHYFDKGREALRAFAWFDWARGLPRHVLNYAFVALLGAIAAVLVHGDRPMEIGGRTLHLFPPHNIVHITFVVLILRLVPWWRTNGRDEVSRMAPPFQQVVRWHAFPLLIWFLLPKRLSSFLWYMGPYNAGDDQKANVGQGLIAYGNWIVVEYHVAMWSALAAAVLLGIALVAGRRLRRGGTVILWVFFLSLLLAANHPNRKARNLHSWLPAGWVAAGIGLALATHNRRINAHPRLQTVLGAGILAGLVLSHSSNFTTAGMALEGGPHPERPTFLELTDFYRPDLDASQRVTVLTMAIVKPMVQWTIFERYGSLGKLEPHWYGFADNGLGNGEGFQRWLDAPTADTLIVFERIGARSNEGLSIECILHGELRDLLASQQSFRLEKRQVFPRHGIEMQVWKCVR